MLGGERAEGAGSPTLQGRNFILFVPGSPSFRVLQKGNEKNSRHGFSITWFDSWNIDGSMNNVARNREAIQFFSV